MTDRVGVLTGGGDCPGSERRHPRRGAPFARPRRRGGGRPRGLARARRGQVHGDRPARDLRDPPARRHDHRHHRGRTRSSRTAAPRRCSRTSRDAGLDRARRDRRRGHARRRGAPLTPSTTSPSSASRRRSTTTCPRPTTPSGSTPRSPIATEAIDRLHTTAESHNRVMVVEVMGRHTGWIAVMSGIAGGADVILIPEQPDDRRGVLRGDPSIGTAAARTSPSSSSARATSSPTTRASGAR